MQQTTSIDWKFHLKMNSVMAVLMTINAAFVYYAADRVMTDGPSMFLLFGFEFLILIITMTSTFVQYVLHVIDGRQEEPWENKTLYIAFLGVIVGFLKLIVYLCFFFILVNFYTLPLHIIIDLRMTFHKFLESLHNLIQARKATTDLDRRFPNPTAEELASVDSTCIICRETMATNSAKMYVTVCCSGCAASARLAEPLRRHLPHHLLVPGAHSFA